jgi:hypothetical protein
MTRSGIGGKQPSVGELHSQTLASSGAVNVVSPVTSQSSKRKVAAGITSKHSYKKAKFVAVSSPTNSPLPMLNRTMSGRSFPTTTKDKQHKLYYEELAPGIIIVYFQKYNKNEELFLQPFYKTLYENEDIKNDLRAIALFPGVQQMVIL